MELVSADAVRDAAERLAGILQPTPVEPSRALSEATGGEVLLKCENLQRTGSFKLRGAYNRIHRLTDEQRAGGVVCASAGNHAQGVALAATLQGVSSTVFMPEQAPIPKVEATRAYGADVRLTGTSFDEALHEAIAFADSNGRVFVHPFDHRDIIAGQGTLGLELVEQVPELADGGTVVVPVGGGGLCSGVAVALRDAAPHVRIIGVQAAGAAAFRRSLAAGEPVDAPDVETIADGIAVKRPGELTLHHIDELVDEIVEVPDDAIARALLLLLERAKLLVEPAGAAGVAALLEGAEFTSPTVAVVSGGNIDPLVLQHVITSGLTAEGRFVTVRTRVPDKPGELHRLLGILAEERANVVAVEHHRFGRRLQLEEVEVIIELETRGPDHIARIRERLRDSDYPVDRM
ncbi:MAG: threonine ammonia-lyase [Actinobacteria bacterium]|nr:threonine ammonia-lyase [Actinomycetota bacterium]